MDPKVASELSLRIPHLALRVREHSARAQYYAERLQALGARVTYPGLPTHPQHALLRRLANPGARRAACGCQWDWAGGSSLRRRAAGVGQAPAHLPLVACPAPASL